MALIRYDPEKIRDLEMTLVVVEATAGAVDSFETNLSGVWRALAFGDEEEASRFMQQIRSNLTELETSVQAAMFALSAAESVEEDKGNGN